MPLWLALVCIAVAAVIAGSIGFLLGAGCILVWQGSAAVDLLAAFDECQAVDRASVGY